VSVVILFSSLAGCAALFQKDELTLELDRLYGNLPSEMVWFDGMFQTWDENGKWKVGYRGRQYNWNLAELVQPPETVENWMELLTLSTQYRTSKVYTYPGGATFTDVPDPVVAMEALRLTVQERCAKPITFQRLDDDRASPYPSVIFFISCERPAKGVKGVSVSPDLPESQMHRMFRGRHAFYHIHRIRHAPTLDQATFDRWASGLKALFVCDDTVPGQECKKHKKP
jgi:hypothetical protein